MGNLSDPTAAGATSAQAQQQIKKPANKAQMISRDDLIKAIQKVQLPAPPPDVEGSYS